MRKLKLSQQQIGRASEIFGNISVAWFSAGIISPLFVKPQNIFDFLVTVVLSLTMASVSFFLSLYLLRRRK